MTVFSDHAVHMLSISVATNLCKENIAICAQYNEQGVSRLSTMIVFACVNCKSQAGATIKLCNSAMEIYDARKPKHTHGHPYLKPDCMTCGCWDHITVEDVRYLAILVELYIMSRARHKLWRRLILSRM